MKKYKINAIDLTVCLLVLALLLLLGGVLVKHFLLRKDETPVELQCVMLISGVRRSFLSEYPAQLPFSVGDAVRGDSKLTLLGQIERVEICEYRSVMLQGETLSFEPDPALADLEVTVRMQGARRSICGWQVQELRIAAGERCNLIFGGFSALGCELLTMEVLSNETVS